MIPQVTFSRQWGCQMPLIQVNEAVLQPPFNCEQYMQLRRGVVQCFSLLKQVTQEATYHLWATCQILRGSLFRGVVNTTASGNETMVYCSVLGEGTASSLREQMRVSGGSYRLILPFRFNMRVSPALFEEIPFNPFLLKLFGTCYTKAVALFPNPPMYVCFRRWSPFSFFTAASLVC